MDLSKQERAERRSIEVFCCYARKDQLLLLELKAHLASLVKEGVITLWADVDINAGVEWEKEILRHLNTAQIILLLISADFIASEYCYSVEMKHAIERHERGEAYVIPIILRPVSWQRTPFAKLQVLPTNANPITGGKWHNQDEAFYDVAEGICTAVESWRLRTSASTGTSAHPTDTEALLSSVQTEEHPPRASQPDVGEKGKQLSSTESAQTSALADGLALRGIDKRQQFVLKQVSIQNGIIHILTTFKLTHELSSAYIHISPNIPEERAYKERCEVPEDEETLGLIRSKAIGTQVLFGTKYIYTLRSQFSPSPIDFFSPTIVKLRYSALPETHFMLTRISRSEIKPRLLLKGGLHFPDSMYDHPIITDNQGFQFDPFVLGMRPEDLIGIFDEIRELIMSYRNTSK